MQGFIDLLSLTGVWHPNFAALPYDLQGTPRLEEMHEPVVEEMYAPVLEEQP